MTETLNWLVVEPGFTKAGLNPFKVRSDLAKAVGQWAKVLEDLIDFREGYAQKGCVVFQMEYGVIDTKKHPDRVAQCNDRHNNWTITFLPDGAPATPLRPKQRWALGWWQDVLGKGDSLLAAAIHELGHVFDFAHTDDDPLHPMNSNFPDCRTIGRRYRSLLREEFIRKHQ